LRRHTATGTRESAAERGRARARADRAASAASILIAVVDSAVFFAIGAAALGVVVVATRSNEKETQ
jgi:hypothetical protein